MICNKIDFIRKAVLLTALIIILPVLHSSGWAQVSKQDVPMIGAELFIEPGQTAEEIDIWLQKMKEAGLTITRIRMFETYMHKPNGSWDFSLFDEAFRAAGKYGIKVYANLFPATSFSDLGGFKYPRDEEHLKSISEYIRNVVTHFGKFQSLYGWVPVNEPGIDRLPDGKYTQSRYQEWSKNQVPAEYNSKGYEHFDFDENRFLLDYNTWFLKWLTDEIRKYDKERPVHVNTHAIFNNTAIYDFPAWNRFLTSLGGSAHASWHFGYFKRSQYCVAMSANSEIIRSGAGPIPWLMTELQGGNNTYSGANPMCPTKEEISQWLWIVTGTESKGAIFWCLNPRASGIEAGEWALLNFRNEPSDRMKAVTEVAGIINKNASLFANARIQESGISILYSRESLWVEKKLQVGQPGPFEGRNPGGVMKSALSYFEALCEMGIQPDLKEFSEYDFSGSDYTGKTIILSHQISIPSHYWQSFSDFVSKGGKLIVDGLTGYYDENAVCIMKTGFPLEKVFGGNIKEFKLVGEMFPARLDYPVIEMPSHLWRGTIRTTTATTIGSFNNEPTAVRNFLGKGEVIWVPSLIGLGARIRENYEPLTEFLSEEILQSLINVQFRFRQHQPGMLMKTLQSGSDFVTIIINKSPVERIVPLIVKKANVTPVILFATRNGSITNNIISISPEETLVIRWESGE